MTDDRLRAAIEASARLAASAAGIGDVSSALDAVRHAARACGWPDARVLAGDGEVEAHERAVAIEASGERLATLVVDAPDGGALSDDDALALENLARVAALAILVARLRGGDIAAAHLDAATGLLNRRGFEDALRREVTNAYRASTRISAVAVEIDRFESLVAPAGDEVANAVLRTVAATLRAELRQGDVVARTAAAQLRVLLPGADAPGARAVAERLRCAIAAANAPGIGTVTATLGVAAIPDHAANGAALVQAAEAAVGTGRRRGRNCVVVALPLRQ
jgi:diguanylate cyclase (GGDEF)-like protein